jgi:hypothetical protein
VAGAAKFAGTGVAAKLGKLADRTFGVGHSKEMGTAGTASTNSTTGTIGTQQQTGQLPATSSSNI